MKDFVYELERFLKFVFPKLSDGFITGIVMVISFLLVGLDLFIKGFFLYIGLRVAAWMIR